MSVDKFYEHTDHSFWYCLSCSAEHTDKHAEYPEREREREGGREREGERERKRESER